MYLIYIYIYNPPFGILFVIPELRSFHDCHKVYGRLEAMKVAKEQARESRVQSPTIIQCLSGLIDCLANQSWSKKAQEGDFLQTE